MAGVRFDVVRLAVRLTPRGGADRVDAVLAGVLHVRVAAAPVDGAANDALIRLIAETLSVPRSAVRLVRGAQSRHKVIEIGAPGLHEIVAERWPELAS